MKRNFLSGGWRRHAGVLLLIAVAAGTTLRFFRLGSRELSIDESLSWAESSGHNIKAVLRVQHQLDSGKFPIYELAQHGWMRVFGESEAAMRSLPALIGSLSIVLVFILGVEVMLAASSGRSDETDEGRVYIVAAVCALIFAVGLPSVEIARQARMYSMMQAWILVQIIFLLRARRLGGLANYAGLTIFSAVAVATNFTAALVIAAEALWLIYLWLAEAPSDERARGANAWTMGVALAAALVSLLPFFALLRYGVEGVARGDYDWIKPPGRWEPFATFESGLGSWPFPLFALFAIIGGIQLWRTHRDEAVLLILWIGLPPIVLLAGSYIVTPMLVTRYLISSFVPFFILTAIGIESIPSRQLRSVALIAIVSLCVLRASADFRPGDNRWRDACEIALSDSCSRRRVGASSEVYLVSYYMHEANRRTVKIVRFPFDEAEHKAPRVVILSPTVSPEEAAAIRREYPIIVGKFKNITVVSRPEGCLQKAPIS
ncbi:glycosyltransferase family 39 protein [Candidatus Binatus sp.]|uniref:glycosyltransferase family 39 protein n=1 Tax=Candidatus Binatus sp. TaxID=2811406 RepID=UPI003BAFD689